MATLDNVGHTRQVGPSETVNVARRFGDRLIDRVKRERFDPSLLGLFVNPNFPTRRRIAAFIRRHAHLLVGDVLDFGGGEMPYRHFAKSRSWLSVEFEATLAGPDLGPFARASRTAADHLPYDGRTIPLPDNSVDTVLATEVFEHLFNLEEILVELHRVLRPGGSLIATIPFAMYEHEIPHDFARYTSFGIRDRLEKAGFTIELLEKLSRTFEVWLQMTTWLWWQGVRRGRRLFWLAVPTLPIVNFASWILEGRETTGSGHFLTLGIIACKPAS